LLCRQIVGSGNSYPIVCSGVLSKTRSERSFDHVLGEPPSGQVARRPEAGPAALNHVGSPFRLVRQGGHRFLDELGPQAFPREPGTDVRLERQHAPGRAVELDRHATAPVVAQRCDGRHYFEAAFWTAFGSPSTFPFCAAVSGGSSRAEATCSSPSSVWIRAR